MLTDNRGYGCINRLQIGCGGEEFNNMYKDCNIEEQPDRLRRTCFDNGVNAAKAANIADLEAQIVAAGGRDRHKWESQPDSHKQ